MLSAPHNHHHHHYHHHPSPPPHRQKESNLVSKNVDSSIPLAFPDPSCETSSLVAYMCDFSTATHSLDPPPSPPSRSALVPQTPQLLFSIDTSPAAFLSSYTLNTVLDGSSYAVINVLVLPQSPPNPLCSQLLATNLFHHSLISSMISRICICPSTVLDVCRWNTPIRDAFQSSLWFRMGNISNIPRFDPRACGYIPEYVVEDINLAHVYSHSPSIPPQVFATKGSRLT
ncbi:hypothetical protein EV426DRAFT_591514 [Tirmania nivea]|nr:hypothetical protein EV426DRAFT_591514 [Tirmania nivea]